MADDSLTLARMLVRQGTLESALPYYIEYLDNNTGTVGYHLTLLEAVGTIKSVSDKIAFMHRYLRHLTSPIARQESFTLLGHLYELKNDFKNAVFCYVQAWQSGRPMLPALALQAAMIQLELGEHQRAISMMNGIFNSTLRGEQREQAIMIYCVAFQFLDQLESLKALLTQEAQFLAGERSASLLYFLYKYYATHQPAQASGTLLRLKMVYPQSPEVKLLENRIRLFPTPAVLW